MPSNRADEPDPRDEIAGDVRAVWTRVQQRRRSLVLVMLVIVTGYVAYGLASRVLPDSWAFLLTTLPTSLGMLWVWRRRPART